MSTLPGNKLQQLQEACKERQKLKKVIDAGLSFYAVPQKNTRKKRLRAKKTKKVKIRKKKNEFKKPKKTTAQAVKNKIDFEKLGRVARSIIPPAPVPRQHDQVPIVRAPGQYSNTSPYGIATEAMMEQLKEENEAKKRIGE